MKPNKRLFLEVFTRISEDCAHRGFVPHPVYLPVWEPGNQCYEGGLIGESVTPDILQMEVSYYPSFRTFYFKITRVKNERGLTDISDIKGPIGEWTDQWLHHPFEIYSLYSKGRFWPYPTQGFILTKRDLQDIGSAITKIWNAYQRTSEHLFDAVRERYKGRYVSVTSYDFSIP